jgi:hypothetical protein
MLNAASDRRPADAAEDIDLNAYNAAFYELGLRWHWDVDTYRDLQLGAGSKEPVRAYLETRQPHLLKAYDADFLADAIEATKARCRAAMTAYGTGTAPRVDWAAIQCVEVGV